jgi:hypothetical protein
VAHDVSDADPTAHPGGTVAADTEAGLDVVTGPPPTVGEPAVANRGLGGLTRGPRWGAPVAPRPAAPPPRRRSRDPYATRRPLIGLAALILTSFVAAFFGWASAEPFWLATGRGIQGTATITSCQPSGLAQRCVGSFTGERIAAESVRLSSVPPHQRRTGATLDARMLDADSRWAYAGPASGLTLRWILGAAIVLLCGLLIGFATGVHRLRTAGRRARLALWLLGLSGPLALYAGAVLAAAL